MDDFIGALFSGPLASRLPAWVLTVGFVLVILKWTGTLERMAKLLSTLITFVKNKDALDSEQERWAAEREAEIEEIHANAVVQAAAAKQLSDQRAQQQLYTILEQSITFLQTDFVSKLNALIHTNASLSGEINEMKVVAAQAKELLLLSHVRIDSITGIISNMAHNFDELKPYLIDLSDGSKDVRKTVSELESAIRLLVEVINHK
jgi:multidrug efflux pump subunit AcrA (membrane-fusion protein)